MVGELFGAHADAIWDAPRAAPRAAGSNGSPHTGAGGGPGGEAEARRGGRAPAVVTPVLGFNLPSVQNSTT